MKYDNAKLDREYFVNDLRDEIKRIRDQKFKDNEVKHQHWIKEMMKLKNHNTDELGSNMNMNIHMNYDEDPYGLVCFIRNVAGHYREDVYHDFMEFHIT